MQPEKLRFAWLLNVAPLWLLWLKIRQVDDASICVCCHFVFVALCERGNLQHSNMSEKTNY